VHAEADVGEEPSADAAAGAGADVTVERGAEHTPPGALGEHSQMVQVPPSSSCSPCGHGSHRL
jgi:hypothetical protein